MPPNQNPQPQAPTPPPPAPTPAPAPAPTPAPAPINPMSQNASVASGMSPVMAIIIVILVLLAAAAGYWYFMYGLPTYPPSAAEQNTLVAEQTPAQDDLSQIEAELNAEGGASFDSEVDNLENSF